MAGNTEAIHELTVDDVYEQLEGCEIINEVTQNDYLMKLKTDMVDSKERILMRNEILMANQKLLLLMALRYYWATNNKDIYNKDELILALYSAANIGFMYAIDRYDLSSGVKLTSYAAHWCKYYMQMEMLNYMGKTRTSYKMENQVKSLLESGGDLNKIKKWSMYLLSNRAIPPKDGWGDIDYDVYIELRVSLDKMGKEGQLLKDYYGIDNDSPINLYEKYKLGKRALEERIKIAQQDLCDMLSDMENTIKTATDSSNDIPENQLEFDFIDSKN